jgi:hypothetical protein
MKLLGVMFNLIFATMIVFLAGTAGANPYLTVETSASVGDGYYQKGYDSDQVYRNTTNPSVETSSSAAYSGPAWGGGTIDSSSVAWAKAEYGKLHSNGYNYGVGGANANAIFSDDWTISSPTLNGTWGDLYVSVTLKGIMSGNASAQVVLGEECLASGTGCRLVFTGPGSNGTTATMQSGTFGFPIHFQYGTPHNIIISLGATASAGGLQGSKFDLSETAWISGLDLRDVNGQAVTNYTLSAASGHSYGFGNQSAVPLPAAVWFLGSGMVGLLGLKRRFSK